MIVAKQKPLEEIIEEIGNTSKLLIVGCNCWLSRSQVIIRSAAPLAKVTGNAFTTPGVVESVACAISRVI